MTKQERLVLRLELQHYKGFIGHLEESLAGAPMEPKVRAHVEKKREKVVAIEAQLKRQ